VNGLLIGFGSVGKKHFKILDDLCSQIFIVDLNLTESTILSENSKVFANIYSFVKFAKSHELKVDLAIIANWGPDHLSTFLELVDINISKFIIEKPLVTSMANLQILRSAIEKNNLQVWCNFHLRFNKEILKPIHNLIDSNKEVPTLWTISGGAKCLATTGIHWIDLFLFINNSNSVKIRSLIKDSKINPRNKDFSFFEGTISLIDNRDNIMNLSFLNSSYSDSNVTIYGKHSKLVLEDNIFKVFTGELENQPNFPITRTYSFNKIISSSVLQSNSIQSLYDSFITSNKPMINLFEANEVLLKALILNEENDLSADVPAEKLLTRDWNFS
jgi:predicted dehydrogenase